MPAIVYPSALPGPSAGWAAVLRERAARSSLPGDPQARRRWRDRIADVTSATWHYSAAEMAIWREWWHETLVDGQLWFSKEAPGPGGWVDRVMRFRPASVRVQPLGNGICRVTAQLEVRGRSAAPGTVVTWGARTAGWSPTTGGTSISEATDDSDQQAMASVGVSTGKRVWGIRVTAALGGIWARLGIRRSDTSVGAPLNSGYTLAIQYSGERTYGDSAAVGGTAITYSHGDITMWAFDPAAGRLCAGVNGTWSAGDPSTEVGQAFIGIEAGLWFPFASVNNDDKDHTLELLAGDDWPYALPTDYQAL